MPTISWGFDGFTETSLSPVATHWPSMRSSYSRPNSERTRASAASIMRRFSGWEKSVYGSLRNSESVAVAISFMVTERREDAAPAAEAASAKGRRAELLLLIALDAREIHLRIVGEPAHPAFVRRAAQPFSLLLDGLERIQVEGRHPGRLQMRGGRHEVGEKAERASAARRGHHAQIVVVPRRALHADAGNDLAIARDQRHAARLDQRIVIRIDVADAVPREPLVRVLPFAPRGEVARPRKRRRGAPVPQNGVSAAMVPVQVAIDDDIDGFRIDARRRDRLAQILGLRLQTHALACPCVHLVAAAGFDQDRVLAGADDVAVEAARDPVQLVRGRLPAPERLRHHAEHRAAIPPVDCRAHRRDLELAGAQRRAAGRRAIHSPAGARARTARPRLRPVAARARTSPCWPR